MAVVEMAITLAMITTKIGQMTCRKRSCVLSECQPLREMATTHRMYGGAVSASVMVLLYPRLLTESAELTTDVGAGDVRTHDREEIGDRGGNEVQLQISVSDHS